MPETSNLPMNINTAPVISTTMGTRCPHCGQEFSEESLNIAVFLYGIFFLIGKEIGYAGITCPKCLHTICHRDSKEAIVTVKKMIGEMICLGIYTFDPQLRYYSSLSGSPKDITQIGAFNIPFFEHDLIGNEPHSLSEEVDRYMTQNSEILENHLCSYVQDGNDPSGAICHIWWINENDVEKLIQIENIKGIKIFPRYYHHCALIEDVDRFCWNYGYANIYLENLKSRTVREHEKLEQNLILQGIDLTNVIDSTPDMTNPSVIEWIQSENQARNASDILNVPGDFLKILIADPEPWGIQSPLGLLCKGFWKTKNPFTTAALPISLSQFSPHSFKETAKGQLLQQAKSDILQEFIKPYVQTYLMQSYASFIRNYVEIIKERYFSYADLWVFKEKYLKELYALVQEQIKLQNKNLFYRENGFWLVSYNGNESLIKNLDGMAYIHFLVENKGKKYAYYEIEKLLNGEVDKEEFEKANKNKNDDSEEDEDKEEGEIDEGFIFASVDQEMITPELLSKIQAERNKIYEQMNGAEKSGDNKRFIELNSYLKKLDEHLKDYIYVKESQNGEKKFIKIKRFKNVTAYKGKKDNVDRVIKYTLSTLEKQNEAAYKHLKISIRNKSGEIWYEPEVDTDWYTS